MTLLNSYHFRQDLSPTSDSDQSVIWVSFIFLHEEDQDCVVSRDASLPPSVPPFPLSSKERSLRA